MASPTLGWGFIGAGGVARRRMLPAVAGQAGVRVAAVQVRNQARAEAIAAEYGVPAAFDDPAALLADPAVEAVYIATPPATHPALVAAAAAAGRHVLVEKPAAASLAGARAMVAAAEAGGVRLAVCFPLRHDPRYQQLRAWLRAGRVGELAYLRAQLARGYDLDPAAWRADPRLAGGGIIWDLGSHLLDLAVWLGGPLARLTAQAHREPGWAVERNALLAGQFVSGALASLELSWCSWGGHGACELYGSAGTAALTDDGARLETDDGVETVPCEGPDVYLAELLDFTEAVTAGRPAVTSGADGVVNTQWLEVASR